jgi:hypothetical protein
VFRAYTGIYSSRHQHVIGICFIFVEKFEDTLLPLTPLFKRVTGRHRKKNRQNRGRQYRMSIRQEVA